LTGKISIVNNILLYYQINQYARSAGKYPEAVNKYQPGRTERSAKKVYHHDQGHQKIIRNNLKVGSAKKEKY
jgi:hypothetical protein